MADAFSKTKKKTLDYNPDFAWRASGRGRDSLGQPSASLAWGNGFGLNAVI
jgi:hypothetical protein